METETVTILLTLLVLVYFLILLVLVCGLLLELVRDGSRNVTEYDSLKEQFTYCRGMCVGRNHGD